MEITTTGLRSDRCFPQYAAGLGARRSCYPAARARTMPSCGLYVQNSFMGWAYMSLAVSGPRAPGEGLNASSMVAIRLYWS